MTAKNLHDILVKNPVSTSAPCRIDMGGTLDIRSFYFPLRHLEPCTFNLAIALRTRVRLEPYKRGWVKVSSRGFDSAAFHESEMPFSHSLGLIFAVAAYFHVSGVHILIDSASPVRSALGGSSVAAVALITALSRILEQEGAPKLSRSAVAMLAFAIEQSVAGVNCGIQDMLAATFGGGHVWYWTGQPGKLPYVKRKVIRKKDHCRLANRLLLAYCGAPHESVDVNGQWVRKFLEGKYRTIWGEIINKTHQFVKCLETFDLIGAGNAMNDETDLRCEMTPHVLDSIGGRLVAAARKHGCGARFTGAGGGGCIWALGNSENISRLRSAWQTVLDEEENASFLDTTIDPHGVL
ncbi:MAG: galactokinase [Desulfobacteraceae bacterium]|jgi:D-glycero-alpha-D-manno-heptose-7-phosphate kinase